MKIISQLMGCILLLLSLTVYAQETEKTRIYETRSNIPAYPCDILGNLVYNNPNRFERAPFKARFAVVRYLKDQSAVVRFLTWSVRTPPASMTAATSTGATSTSSVSPSASSQDQAIAYNISLNAPLKVSSTDTTINTVIKSRHSAEQQFIINRFFIISKNDLDSNCVKVFASGLSSTVFTLGLVTMPMKLRLGQNFDFQGNLSLGTTAGGKMRISEYSPNYLNLLLGLSLSTVALDSFSTGGRVSGQPITNIAVFSPSVGLVFEFGKAQVGAFLGWDLLNKSTQIKYDWIYDRRPWLSIGFGFSIFSVDSKTSTIQNVKQTVPSSAPNG